jgi:uncharacterized membrane protein
MICFLSWTWLLMLQATPETMRRYSRQSDEGRLVILSLITAAACVSLFAIGALLHDKGLSNHLLILHLGLSILTIVGSWLLVQTIFALHYARTYYQDHKTLRMQSRRVRLSGEIEPDYGDFLFLFRHWDDEPGVGCKRHIAHDATVKLAARRFIVLFNTIILALTINIIAGLI